MPKKIYRVEVELRVTSLDVSRDEIPVAKTPTWQEVLGILERGQIHGRFQQRAGRPARAHACCPGAIVLEHATAVPLAMAGCPSDDSMADTENASSGGSSTTSDDTTGTTAVAESSTGAPTTGDETGEPVDCHADRPVPAAPVAGVAPATGAASSANDASTRAQADASAAERGTRGARTNGIEAGPIMGLVLGVAGRGRGVTDRVTRTIASRRTAVDVTTRNEAADGPAAGRDRKSVV